MDPRRAERVSESIREELSEIIQYELSDPRLADVSISDVHLAPDGSKARVMVTVPGDENSRQECLDALEGARHYIRRELAKRLTLFRVPDLRFESGADLQAARVGKLLKRIRKGRPKEE